MVCTSQPTNISWQTSVLFVVANPCLTQLSTFFWLKQSSPYTSYILLKISHGLHFSANKYFMTDLCSICSGKPMFSPFVNIFLTKYTSYILDSIHIIHSSVNSIPTKNLMTVLCSILVHFVGFAAILNSLKINIFERLKSFLL